MPNQPCQELSIVGRRLRERREALGMAQEKVGIAFGLDESSARARISRYELGVHEPPLNTVKRLAAVLQVSVAYLYCEDEDIAQLLLSLYALPAEQREERIQTFQSLLPSRPVQADACDKRGK
jgi:transcriptional regulator with XRE-family HTH domain